MAEEETPFPSVLDAANLPEYLGQGDFIADIVRRGSATEIPDYGATQALGFLVLSNTCDLVQPNRLAFLAMSPVFSLNQYLRNTLEERIAPARESGGELPSEKNLSKNLQQAVFRLSNYGQKGYFFLPPDDTIGLPAAVCYLEMMFNYPLEELRTLLDHRRARMLAPWREQLGFHVGYLFNRVATITPDQKGVEEWSSGGVKRLVDEALDA